MKNVLLVGEDVHVLQGLKKSIYSYFDAVHIASFYNGEAHLQLSSSFADVVCVDVDSIMGFSFQYFEKLSKSSGKRILFLTSVTDLDNLQQFVQMPLNDYVLKPYHPSEVIVRMIQLLGKTEDNGSMRENRITKEIVPGLLLDAKGAALVVDGQRKRLPRMLRVFMETLVQNTDTLVTHQYLYEKIWGDYEDMGTHREIRAHAKRLRNMMGRHASMLVNIKAQGYMLVVDDVIHL